MLSTHFATLLKPYKLLTTRHALSPTYRCLQFAPGTITGCAPFGILETIADHGLEETAAVDATAFLAIMDSLPSDQEVTLTLEEGVLRWKCGKAKGALATIVNVEMPSIEAKRMRNGYTPTSAFMRALDLGAISCDSTGLQSVGMYGVVIDGRGADLLIHSTDNTTVSAARIVKGKIKGAPPLVTITPEAAALLGELMIPDGTLEFTETAINYKDKHCRAMISQAPPLQHDTGEMVGAFQMRETTARIDPALIASFIKRVGALAENKRHSYISLTATKGQLSLAFEEGIASADEYYLVDDLDVPDLYPIHLDATKIARVLQNVTHVALDYADRNVLVFYQEDDSFVYIISGKGEAQGQEDAQEEEPEPEPEPDPPVKARSRKAA